jgi:hypothetical protein
MVRDVAAVTDQPRAWRFNRRVAALVIVVAVFGGVFWSLVRSGDPFAIGTRSFTGSGISLSYPAGWIVNDQGWATSGLGSTFAFLGTQPWGACLPSDINCHYQLRLEPSQISVALARGLGPSPTICEVGANRSDLAGRGPSDPPATGHLLRVDGRPTLQTDYTVNQTDYYHSDEWRTWVIAAPGTTAEVYRVDAMYRGPGNEAFRQQLDALIASIKFTDSGGPADCGAPFPAGS